MTNRDIYNSVFYFILSTQFFNEDNQDTAKHIHKMRQIEFEVTLTLLLNPLSFIFVSDCAIFSQNVFVIRRKYFRIENICNCIA